MADMSMRLGVDTLVIDGGMGTMLQSMGVSGELAPEFLNVADPESVLEVHRLYRLAGADCATSNTFGGTRNKLTHYGLADQLAELNQAGIRLAREGGAPHVLADVGPCGLVMQPAGEATFEEVYDQYAEQITALAVENPDAILIETMTDIADARAALLAAKEVCDLPVIVSCSFDETGRMPLSGTDPETAAVILDGLGADVIGMNCSTGPEAMLPLIARMRSVCSTPILVQPNAGIPRPDGHGGAVYDGTPDELAEFAIAAHRAGASLIGSCCGSTPPFTTAIRSAVGGKAAPSATSPVESTRRMYVASPSKLVRLGDGQPCRMIGERINPTGKKELTSELERGSFSLVRRFAVEQTEAGADILDINVGAPSVNAVEILPQAVMAVMATVQTPIAIDTTDLEALEAALRIYPGRALINSANGDPDSYMNVIPLAKKYGAAVVVLGLDQDGIPEDAAGRSKIIRAVVGYGERSGMPRGAFVADGLVMTVAADPDAAATTLETMRLVKQADILTMLGVSNVSHGLPHRPELNAAFLDAAITGGLDLAIVNPNEAVVANMVEVASASRETRSFEEAYAAWEATLTRVQEMAAEGTQALAQPLADGHDQVEPDPAQRLSQAVFLGDVDSAPFLVDAAIESGIEADRIIPSILTPAIQRMGDAYGRGETFLPQMMVAADAMKTAVARVKEHMPPAQADDSIGTIVFCTVKGDVHSIGKDICIALLESQGVRVIDLGVDVPADDVLTAIATHGAGGVCLSALMTTTLPSMADTVAAVRAEYPDIYIGVGGAVVTPEWAASVGAHYTSDAPSCTAAVVEALTASPVEKDANHA